MSTLAVACAMALGLTGQALPGQAVPGHTVPAAATADSDALALRLFAVLNGAAADGPAAWESWPSAADTFRRDGADPGPWRAGSRAGNGRFELLTPQAFPDLRRIVHGRWISVTDPLAVATRLVEVRLNPLSFEYVRGRRLYTVDGQRRAVTRGGVEFPVGSIQLKAAWRPISDAERPRYHTMTVRLADGGTRLFGLTALNFAAKTATGWLWASFEHVDGEYRLRGTQTAYVDAAGQPVRLGNAELEADLGDSASCMTCHSRATVGTGGEPARLPVFAPAPSGTRRGYVGVPDPAWFGHAGAQGGWQVTYAQLDYVWSLAQAAPRGDAASSTGKSP